MSSAPRIPSSALDVRQPVRVGGRRRGSGLDRKMIALRLPLDAYAALVAQARTRGVTQTQHLADLILGRWRALPAR